MGRILVLSLAVLCWAYGSSAQTCGGCTERCSGIDTDRCCLWDNPPIDMDTSSFSDPEGTPLGFTTAFFPRVESGKPKPCVTVAIADTVRQTYIQVAMESDAPLCIVIGETEACGQVLHFCEPSGYKNVGSVTFRFDCDSCPSAEVSLRFRINMQTVDRVDEHWCENANMTLPSDLVQQENTAFTVPDISQPEVVDDSVPPLSLVTSALLLVCLLIAAALSF